MKEVLIEKRDRDTQAKSMYVQILGATSLPESPSQFPDTFQLPKEPSQTFHDLRMATAQSGNELCALISVSRNRFKNQLIYGDQEGVGQPDYKEIGRVFFGQKPLIDYHTHPVGKNSFVGLVDLHYFMSTPRGAYMFGVGTDIGYWLFAQSQAAMKLPLLYSWRRLHTLYSIRDALTHVNTHSKERGNTADEKASQMIEGIILSLKNSGLATYFCPDPYGNMPPNAESLLFTLFMPEDSQIKLTPQQRRNILRV